MTIKVNNLVLDISEDSLATLKHKVAKKLGVKEENFKSFKILKESIDARKKDAIKFNYAVFQICSF